MTNKVPSTVVIQEEETILHQHASTRLIWKLDRRLIPFLAFLEINRFGFQIAIGHAPLTTFKSDLNLTTTQDDWATTAFFLAYFSFAIPSCLILRFIGVTRYLSLSLIAWGAITIGMAFIKNAQQLIILRFLLGMVTAGYFPGSITYISLWYRKREQVMRITIFCVATFASGALGGVLAYGTRKMDGIAGLKSWQWLFLLPGFPTIPLGIITYFILGNIPETVQWLDNAEKQFLTNLLRNDEGAANSEPTSDSLLSWRQVRSAFVDRRIYLYVMIGTSNFCVKKFLLTYLPLIILCMKYSEETAHLMTVIPYSLSCLSMLLGGYSSSRRNEHAFHLIFSLSIGLVGFLLMIILIDQHRLVIYAGLCLACCGTFSALPILLSWLTNNVGGNTKRTLAVGMLVGAGQIGGIFQPQIYRVVDQPTYRRCHIIASCFLASAIVLSVVLRFWLVMENRRREHLLQDEYDREANLEEPCDWHPDNRYVL